MKLTNLLYWSYWFTQPNLAARGVEKTYLIILFGITLIGGVFLFLKQKQVEKAIANLYGRYGNWGVTMGLTGLVLFFFRQQHVFFLGWRIWFLIWLAVLVVWLLPIVRYHVRRVPEIRQLNKARLAKEKYLP